VELHALNEVLLVAQAHHDAVGGGGGDFERIGDGVFLYDQRMVAGRREGRAFLENYYKKSADEVMADLVCHFGSPAECAERIGGYVREGVRTVILRFAASNQLEQLTAVTEELLPLFGQGTPGARPPHARGRRKGKKGGRR